MSCITPIHKSGPKGNICNYRPISKLSNISKLFEHIVYQQIFSAISPFISESQHGFFKNRSTVTNLLVFTNFCITNIDRGFQIDTIYLDFCKAFDKVVHSILIKKLYKIGFHSSLLKWIDSYLSGRRCIVCIDNWFSASYIATSGVPQGSVLGPLLFILFVNDVCEIFSFCKCLLYADDIKLFSVVSNRYDMQCLQEDLNVLCRWTELNHLPLNVSKCHHLSYGRRLEMWYSDYFINDQILIKVDNFIDLGVVFDSKLEFKLHINYIMPKAYSMLAFIKRNSSDFNDPYTRKLLFTTFVRSKIEYAAIIWNPYYKVNSDRIEKIQKFFLKFALYSLHFREPIPAYEARCKLIHLDTLVNRRKRISVIFIFKLICGLIDCPCLLSLVGFNVPSRCLRFNEMFNVPLHRRNYSINEPVLRSLRELNKINSFVQIDISGSFFYLKNLLMNIIRNFKLVYKD